MTATTTKAASPLKATTVMARLGFKDRGAFWNAVHREGIPHTRISARNIVFFETQLNDWISRRSIGRAA